MGALPGSPAAAMPPGEDAVVRRVADVERTIRELNSSVAASLVSTVAALVSPAVDHVDVGGFALTGSSTELTRVTIPVPPGYTRALVSAAAGVSAYNNNSGFDISMTAQIDINGVTSSRIVQTTAFGLSSGMASASAGALLTSLGDEIYVRLLSRTAGPTFAADASNAANLDVTVLFLNGTVSPTPSGGGGGVPGPPGPAGPGVAVGGATGYVLTKLSGADFDTGWAPASGGGSLPTRTTATYTTASLANNAQETGLITLAPGYRVYKVVLSVQGRVRLYDSTAHRTADLSRAKGTPVDPLTDSGLMLEVALQTGSLTRVLSPLVDGVNFESGDGVPITVQNLSGSSSVVTVTVTFVKAE